MRKLFALALVALLLGVAIVAIIQTDPGYVLVAYDNVTLEASLWVGLLLLLALVTAFFLFLRLTYHILAGRRSLASWLGARKSRNALRLTTRGIISYAEGNWQQALKELQRGARHSETPLVNHLLAARASAALRDDDTALEYLRKAGDAEPDAAIAIAMTQAEMQLQAGRYRQAITTLERAAREPRRHPRVLELQRQAYLGLQDWDALLRLLPQLRKHASAVNGDLWQLERQVHSQRLLRDAVELQRLHDSWHAIPKQLQGDTGLVESYTRGLIALGDHEAAGRIILRTLKREWSAPLVRQYALVEGESATKQLARAEEWLADHPGEPELLLCLGRLSVRAELWGKARKYFEDAHRLRRSAEVCAELGRLLTVLGETAAAAEYYREGLLLREDGLPALPAPGKSPSGQRLSAPV